MAATAFFTGRALTRSLLVSSSFNRRRCISSCPFQILGIPKTSSYVNVKKAFVELALQHHPDTAEDKSQQSDTFTTIRQAFESIRNDNGRATVVQGDSEWTDKSLDAWFYRETGQHLSFHMDSSTRREVARVAETMSPGGLDKGGMWAMADMIAKQGTSGGEDPLQVTCGRKEAKSNATSGRRRRK